MPIRGARIPFFGKPVATAGGESRTVKIFPVQEELRNGRLGMLNEWRARPGYEAVHSTGARGNIVALAEHQGQVAISSDGVAYRSTRNDWQESRRLRGRLDGFHRPCLVHFDASLLVTDGGRPKVIEEAQVRDMGFKAIKPGRPRLHGLERGRVPDGVWAYRITYTTALGESLPGPESTRIELSTENSQGVKVYRPAMSDEEMSRVLRWNVYRQVAGNPDTLGFVATADIEQPEIDDMEKEIGQKPPEGDQTESLPPRARYCCVVGDVVVMAGYDPTEFRWSTPGSAEVWPESNYGSIQLNGARIRNIKGLDKDLFVFTSKTLEIHALVGGDQMFARRFTVQRGCHAPDSVVMVQGSQPYWLGDDGIFYRLNGAQAEAIGILEQDFVWSMDQPNAVVGMDFPHEKVVRWFFYADRTCLGFNYAKQHFFVDTAWDGMKWQQLPIFSTIFSFGTTYVGLDGGRIGKWGDEFLTDEGRKIRTVRRFTLPLSEDGRNARANLLMFRYERGTSDNRAPLQGEQWSSISSGYTVGQLVYWRNPDEPAASTYRCKKAHTPFGTPFLATPGYVPGSWEAYWEKYRADTDQSLTVRWGFDQGVEQDRKPLPFGELGDTDPYVVFGPCGLGREMWIEVERTANVPFMFTGGAVVAAPLGDAM